MLHVASVCTPCCMLLNVVACCCAKFETGQTFQPTTPNISFVPWSPKRSATMLDPFAQLFQHCWGRVRSLRMVYKDLWVLSFPRCTAGPNIVGSCCVRLHAALRIDIFKSNLLFAAPGTWGLPLIDNVVKLLWNGHQKLATCFATLLQNELNSDMARFTTHVQACYQPDSLQDRFDVDGKTRHINIQLFCSNVACFLLPVLPYLKKSLFSFFL